MLTVHVLEMYGQIALCLEGSRTLITSEAPVLVVGELEVVGEVGFCSEGFGAFVTLIWPLVRVDAAMSLPMRLVVEAFVAHAAPEVDFVLMCFFNMLLERSPRSVRPTTLITFECFVVSVLLFPM